MDTRARRRARIMVAENDPTVQYRLTHMCYDHTTAFYPTDPHMTPTQRLPARSYCRHAMRRHN